MRMLVELKTPERVILVSDGTSATGMPDGKYQLGMFEVKGLRGSRAQFRGQACGQHADAGPRVAEYGRVGRASRVDAANADRKSGAADRAWARAKACLPPEQTRIWCSSMKSWKCPT